MSLLSLCFLSEVLSLFQETTTSLFFQLKTYFREEPFKFTGINLLVLVSFMVVMAASPAFAGKNVFGVSWNLSTPTGNTADFLSDFSFRGMGIEYKTFFTPNTAFGMNVAWNVMVEEMDEVQHRDGFSVSGMRHNYVNTVPVYLSGNKTRFWYVNNLTTCCEIVKRVGGFSRRPLHFQVQLRSFFMP